MTTQQQIDSVFGATEGEQDPTGPALDAEWLEILEQICNRWDAEEALARRQEMATAR